MFVIGLKKIGVNLMMQVCFLVLETGGGGVHILTCPSTKMNSSTSALEISMVLTLECILDSQLLSPFL
jgi:hypothetical protein